jgi:murein DD-endopeptidase MepM/ murein hydrolase activator NlpD
VILARAALAALLLTGAFVVDPAVAPLEAQDGADQFRLSGSPVQGGLIFGRVPSGTLQLSLDRKPVPFDSEGRFILGFDRNQDASALLAAQLANGSWIQQWLRVAPRAWQIEHIAQDRPSSGPTPAYQRIRDGELARIAAARGAASDTKGWRQNFVLPAQGRISGLFGSQRIYRGGVPAAFHSGLDIAPGAGKPVVAPADGVVVLAGPPAFSLEGNLVIVDHGMGLNSAFLHMATSLVQVGDRVRQGQQIGTVGMTGRATGPHLHWSVTWRGARLDPMLLVRSRDASAR